MELLKTDLDKLTLGFVIKFIPFILIFKLLRSLYLYSLLLTLELLNKISVKLFVDISSLLSNS